MSPVIYDVARLSELSGSVLPYIFGLKVFPGVGDKISLNTYLNTYCVCFVCLDRINISIAILIVNSIANYLGKKKPLMLAA